MFQFPKCFALFLLVLSSTEFTVFAQATESGDARKLIRNPVEFSSIVKGEQGFIIVPENRSQRESRDILVHFIHLKSASSKKLAPVFVLPGGPGEPYTEERIQSSFPVDSKFGLMTEIAEYLKDRDVVMVNQRGNQRAPGLLSREFIMTAEPSEFDVVLDFENAGKRLTDGAKACYEKWQAAGMDLSGYDIINLVDDVNDLRLALGYEKICLRGSSFGSQSSLAVMRRYPGIVDRAILHGIEPLDYGYDDPAGIWKFYQRLDEMASEQEDLNLEKGELITAIKTLVKRLETNPVTVESRHPRRELRRKVTLGADDLRMYLSDSRAGNSRRESLEYWPAYIKDMLSGDFRYLAAQIIDDRPESYQGILMSHLMDNSLGISSRRESKLNGDDATRWLGDINWRFKATREVSPTRQVPEAFVQFQNSDIPVLLIQGNLDWSTPYENATDIKNFFPNGHLITIDGGTHGTVRDAQRHHKDFPSHLYKFMKNDFELTSPAELYSSMPEVVKLPKLKFKRPSKSFYEIFIERGNQSDN